MVEQSPKVSVLIPAYNAMDYLPQTLESVMAQDFLDYEVVIVNDGSSDAIEDWYAGLSDERVRLISQENRGLAGARNTAIAHARGEYLALLDADDLWEPEKLRLQVDVLEQNPGVGLVYTWLALVDMDAQPTGRFLESTEEGWVWRDLIHRNFVGCGSTPLIRRDCFDELGGFDENLGSYMEDLDMWLRLSLQYEFRVIKQPLVGYRQRPNSASKNWDAMLRSSEILFTKAFENPPKDVTADELKQLRAQGYGRSRLSLAWQPLLSETKNYSKSKELSQAALSHDPSLRFSKDYLRLKVTMLIMQLLGDHRYSQLLAFIYRIRRARFAV